MSRRLAHLAPHVCATRQPSRKRRSPRRRTSLARLRHREVRLTNYSCNRRRKRRSGRDRGIPAKRRFRRPRDPPAHCAARPRAPASLADKRDPDSRTQSPRKLSGVCAPPTPTQVQRRAPGGVVLRNHFFITGTDTGVGKTTLSALLCAALDAVYWKPIQTGTLEGSDRVTVMRLAGIGTDRTLDEVYKFVPPVSPDLAARWAGVEIDLGRISLPPSLANHL